MAVITQQRRVDNIASTQRKLEMHQRILELEPNSTPFTVILRNLRRLKTGNPEFKWHDIELESDFDAVNDATPPNAAATAVTVDTPTLFASEYLVKVPRTGEVFLVESVSGNDLTIVRGVGGTTAADFVDNDPLYIIGHAAEEGDTSPDPRSQNPVPRTNYTQIFRRAVAESGSALSSDNESAPHDWPLQQRLAGIEHNKQIEKAFLFGAPSSDAGGASAVGDRRTTGGVLYWSTYNQKDAGGALTFAEVEDWLADLFTYGSGQRTVFAGNEVISAINSLAQAQLTTYVGADTYGVKVYNWVSAHGEVKFVKHPLLKGATYAGYGIGIDFDRQNIAYRFLGGGVDGSRDTRLLKDRAENDRDGKKEEYLTEAGLQYGLPKCAGVLYGVTA